MIAVMHRRVRVHEAQIGFMDEARRVQRSFGRCATKSVTGERAQLRVHRADDLVEAVLSAGC